MLELRPSCENCDRTLPPDSTEARICSYECTFCRQCVESILHNVCPNCGGGFAPRPIRPATNWVNDNYLNNHPASAETVSKPVDLERHRQLLMALEGIPPEQR